MWGAGVGSTVPGAFNCRTGLVSSPGLNFLQVCTGCAPVGTFSSLFPSERNQPVQCESVPEVMEIVDDGRFHLVGAEGRSWLTEQKAPGANMECRSP